MTTHPDCEGLDPRTRDMIIRFIIRPFFALLMLIACIAASPTILDWVTPRVSSEGTGEHVFSRGEVIQKVQALYESKPLSEMTMNDLFSLINSPETEQFSDKKKAELRHMLTDELKLSAEEIKGLGSFYQQYIGTPNSTATEDATTTDTPDSGIRQSTGLSPTNGL